MTVTREHNACPWLLRATRRIPDEMEQEAALLGEPCKFARTT
jgi:hypothetical protein